MNRHSPTKTCWTILCSLGIYTLVMVVKIKMDAGALCYLGLGGHGKEVSCMNESLKGRRREI